MKWYKMVEGELHRTPHFFMALENDLKGHDWLGDFSVGNAIKKWNPDCALRSTEAKYDGAPDDILANAFGLLIFSANLRDAMFRSEVGTRDVQYLPIRVARSTGESLPGFAIANVLTRLPALDREHSKMLDVSESEFDPLTGQAKVLGAWAAGLKGEVLVGHDLIRLVEFFSPVFFSDRFVKFFRSNRFTGAAFKPVPVY
jgi:hypothetical protein